MKSSDSSTVRPKAKQMRIAVSFLILLCSVYHFLIFLGRGISFCSNLDLMNAILPSISCLSPVYPCLTRKVSRASSKFRNMLTTSASAAL